MNSTSHSPIAQLLWPASSGARGLWRALALTVGGVAALTVSAKIQIPFHPVPFTFQPMLVVLLGMAYGTRLGVATMVMYLAAGAAGLPVFAGTPEKGVGIAYMLGTTGGYLLGFVLAAAVCGMLARRGFDRSFWRVAAAMLAGNAMIYLPGLLWLGSVVGWDKPVLQYGLWPFVWGDLAKVVLAAAVFPPVVRAVRRR